MGTVRDTIKLGERCKQLSSHDGCGLSRAVHKSVGSSQDWQMTFDDRKKVSWYKSINIEKSAGKRVGSLKSLARTM